MDPTASPATEASTGSSVDLTPSTPQPQVEATKRTAGRRFDRSLIEGPIARAVWKLAWPTVLQNAIGGLQGIVDHAMVGHYVGYAANAAIGVSWQIFLVIIVFISSLFTGMGVLVARAAGANDHDRVDRVVYQAFLVAVILSVGVLAPIGYVLAPHLLGLVHATPEVSAEALPYLRTMFLFSIGMLLFFMLGGALRAAGDAKTPLRLGVMLTVLNISLNVMLISGAGPIPAMGTRGAALGTVMAGGIVAFAAMWMILTGRMVVHFKRGMSWKPDLQIIRQLFRFGLPAGLQGVAMNIAGVLLLRFIGSLEHSAEAQAAYAVAYSELFSLITWTSVGLMGAAAAVAGQNLGAGNPERSARAVHLAARMGLGVAGTIAALFVFIPDALLAIFAIEDPIVVALGTELLRYLSISAFFITVALTFTGGLQGTGDTRGPLYITLVSQIAVPIGICFTLQQLNSLTAAGVWTAIVLGHATRSVLTVWRFEQGKWKTIRVD